jgi:hypothetical protein
MRNEVPCAPAGTCGLDGGAHTRTPHSRQPGHVRPPVFIRPRMAWQARPLGPPQARAGSSRPCKLTPLPFEPVPARHRSPLPASPSVPAVVRHIEAPAASPPRPRSLHTAAWVWHNSRLPVRVQPSVRPSCPSVYVRPHPPSPHVPHRHSTLHAPSTPQLPCRAPRTSHAKTAHARPCACKYAHHASAGCRPAPSDGCPWLPALRPLP